MRAQLSSSVMCTIAFNSLVSVEKSVIARPSKSRSPTAVVESSLVVSINLIMLRYVLIAWDFCAVGVLPRALVLS